MSYIARRLGLFLRSEIEAATTRARIETVEGVLNGSDRASILAAQMLFESRGNRPVGRLRDASAQVFSQFGEDGIIDYIFRRVPPVHEYFVEVGAEDFTESNARFLMQAHHWSGLVIDGSDAAAEWLRVRAFTIMRDVRAVQMWVERDNLAPVLADGPADPDLFSLDIDGNDYWVWHDIPDSFRPRVVIVEFQPNFGSEAEVTSPYRPDFDRRAHHYSGMAAGASLAALVTLGKQKGYDFVGTNGLHNASFVRTDLRPETLPTRTAAEEWREPRYRDVERAGRALVPENYEGTNRYHRRCRGGRPDQRT